jgi:hypothetical protein
MVALNFSTASLGKTSDMAIYNIMCIHCLVVVSLFLAPTMFYGNVVTSWLLPIHSLESLVQRFVSKSSVEGVNRMLIQDE